MEKNYKDGYLRALTVPEAMAGNHLTIWCIFWPVGALDTVC